MSAEQNKQLLREVFEQLSVGNTRAMSDAMADDCRWVFPGEWSWSGVWEPKRAVLDELLRPLMAQFENGYRSEADLILGDGDQVVVQARGRAVTRRGEAYKQTYCYVFRVRDGQITEVVEHCDTALVERVLESPRRASLQATMPPSGQGR
jgi:ketosteroid isomerase-like protein